ncbi:unnamed protein product [Ambrosiozyma monospora]|uniref:Unnamed protein product n=1 Tax=Ambrosiozyma monospora TaxID=43982 RepID=A0ACB5T5T7_AMBMO|nr:unnamed protein product [Ambrosiozyma monospora]
MRANVFIGVIQYFLWFYQAGSSFNKSRKHSNLIDDLKDPDVNWTLTPIVLVMSVLCGMSFEMFDFAPMFDLLDAHALWHFATIWPALFWYSYMVRDVEDGLKDKKYD